MTFPTLVSLKTTPNDVVKHYAPNQRDLIRTSYSMADLNTGSQLVIWSLPKWLQKAKHPGPFDDQIFEDHNRIRIPAAAESIEECMTLLANAAMRPVLIERPCQKFLSCDELCLLQTFRALQSGHKEVAYKSIRKILHGRLGRIFCRSAEDYVMLLARVGFELNRISKLKVVEN